MTDPEHSVKVPAIIRPLYFDTIQMLHEHDHVAIVFNRDPHYSQFFVTQILVRTGQDGSVHQSFLHAASAYETDKGLVQAWHRHSLQC